MVDRGQAVAAVGIPWYRRHDYKRALEIMSDRDVLPITFDKWQSAAENVERGLRSKGHTAVRAHLDPDEFIAWCAEHGHDPNASGRNAFAAAVAYRMVRN